MFAFPGRTASPKLGAHLKSTTSKEDPALWRKGHDPQLEEGVEVALQELKGHPTPQIKRPKYPVYNWQKVRADASKGQSTSSGGGSGQDR